MATDKPERKPLVSVPGYVLYSEPQKHETYLVDPLIPTGCQFLLTGERGSWKSWFLTSLVCCVATGGKFLDRFGINTTVPNNGSVLFVQLEERRNQAKRKYQWTLTGMGLHRDPQRVQDLLVEYVVGRAFTLDDPGYIDDLKLIIDRLKPDLVVWDSLRRMLRGNSNDDEFAMRLVYALSILQEVHPSTHGVVAHMRKKKGEKELDVPGERVRGTSAMPDQVDCHINIERDRLNDFATVSQPKNRDGKEHPDFNFRMRIVDSEGIAQPQWIGVVSGVAANTDPSGCASAINDLLADGTIMLQADIIGKLGSQYNRDQVRRTIARMESGNIIDVDRRNRNRTLVTLKRRLDDPGQIDIGTESPEPGGQVRVGGQNGPPTNRKPYADA